MSAALAALIFVAGCSLDSSAVAPGDADPSDAALDGDRDSASDSRVPTDTTPTDSHQLDTSPGDSATDAPPADAGVMDFYDVDWETPRRLTSTIDETFCETDASVSPDGRWLMFSRSTDPGGCYLDRRYLVMEWNDGAPRGPSTMLPTFDAAAFPETNAHPLDGAWAGRPGRVLFFHAAQPGGGPRDIRAQFLAADGVGAPVVPEGSVIDVAAINTGDAESDPTLNGAGTEIIFTRLGELYSARGTAPSSYGASTPITELNDGALSELDPALSPDGRVLVFAKEGSAGDLDIFVARRRDPTGTFEAPTRLPRGGSQINTSNDELDCFITPRGDLLFTSTRDDDLTRLWLAPLAP